MVTASNSSGEPVVQYFSGQTGEQLDACGSFVRLKLDENSKLAGICKDWGLVSGKYFFEKWGHGELKAGYTGFPPSVHLNNVGDLNDMECDDIASQSVHSIGDFWRVFVSYVSCV